MESEDSPLCILKLCRADLLYGILINDVLGIQKAPPLTAITTFTIQSDKDGAEDQVIVTLLLIALTVWISRQCESPLTSTSTTSSATASVTKFIERELPAVLVVAFMHAPLAPLASLHSVPFTGTAASKFIHNSRSRRE